MSEQEQGKEHFEPSSNDQSNDNDQLSSKDELALVLPLPDFADEQSTVEWLRKTLPLMREQSSHRENLERIVQRHDFRKRKTQKGAL